MKKIKIATRKSPLALWQAEFVKAELEKHHKGIEVELVKMSTRGDEILGTSLAKIGGKGLFIKELEVGMLEGIADIAVHSMKDVPYELPEQFELGAILKRENPTDAFVSNNYKCVEDLPLGAKVGTCSNRRIVQIKSLRPDLQILDLRGNVNTRLKKLDDGEFDAIILASAGLIRLGFEERITRQMSFYQSLPAVGQGAVGIEIRKNDTQILELIKPLIDSETTLRLTAERAMNAKLEGSCSAPIAGFATIVDDSLNIKGLVGDVNNNITLTSSVSGNKNNAKQLGEKLAENLLNQGAKKLLIPQ
jgi:hydroxymethylbilane synthase